MYALARKRNRTSHAVHAGDLSHFHTSSKISGTQRSNIRNILNAVTVQPKLTIGGPDNKYEQEADRVADRVMQMPDTGIKRQPEPEEQEEEIQGKPISENVTPLLQRTETPEGDVEQTLQTKLTEALVTPQIQRMCPACEEVQRQPEEGLEEGPLQAEQQGDDTPEATQDLESGIQSLKGGGQQLTESSRAFFEPRFGQDFGSIRVHTDSSANRLARSINARAFTLSNNIVFGPGEYQPHSTEGKRLMAHELTHVIQQSSGVKRRIQREVLIGDPEDASDPLHGMDSDERNKMIEQLVSELGEGFTVVSNAGPGGTTGKVVPSSPDYCTKAAAVASGSKAVGDCCLCILTQPGSKRWIIRVVLERGASTHPGTGTINIPSSTSPAVSGHWTQGDVRKMRPRVITFAHELCGHAALFEVKAHPEGSRISGTRHDPTIEVEQGVWAEQGLPAADERGLASGPVHRGESFTRVVVKDFPFGKSDPALLPASERSKLELAAKLAHFPNSGGAPDFFNNRWIDITGHSDKPANSAKDNNVMSEKRAKKVRDFMISKLKVPNKIELDSSMQPIRDLRFQSVNSTVDRFTDIRGVADSACTSAVRDSSCRKVEIFISSFPAGAGKPVPGTPSGPATLTPPSMGSPAALATAKASLAAGDACVKLLINKAWPTGLR